MAADVVPYFRPQFLDLDGKPLAGGKIRTYKAGTSSELATYQDAAFTPNENPIILDSSGCADIFIGIQPVKFVIFDENDVLIKTIDNVVGASGSTVGIQTIVPITTNGVQTRFALGVDAELVQNLTAVVVPNVGSRIVYMTTEYTLDGQDIVFNVAPATGTGEIRIGHTRAIATSGLSDGIVSTSKLQNLAVTNAKIALNAVATGNIQDEAVTGPKIDDGAVSTPKLADLGTTTAKLAAGAVTKEKIADAAILSLLLGRNKIVNGDFNLWQRATSFSSVADLTNTADHWIYRKNGSMVHTVSQSNTVPSVATAGMLFTHSKLVQCTTADTSIASSDFCRVSQGIEGYTFQSIAQRPFTVSFLVYATKTGTYCASFGGAASTHVYVAEYTVNASNTWEMKRITIPASPAAGSWDYANGLGLGISFVLAAGSNFHISPNTWTSGSGWAATANQVNACDSTSNVFHITGVQIEEGDKPKGFEPRPYNIELFLAMRRREVIQSKYLGYNPNISASQAIGGTVLQKVPKRGGITSSSLLSSFVGNCTNAALASDSGVLYACADFAAAGAGPAYLWTNSIVESELFF